MIVRAKETGCVPPSSRKARLPPCAIRLWVLAAIVFAGCAGSTQARQHPFEGRETALWLAYEMEIPGRDPSDLLPAFEASARALGCTTAPLGYASKATIGGEIRQRYGVTAYCEQGTLALVTLTDDRVRIGCAKPTTRNQCDTLLENICGAR